MNLEKIKQLNIPTTPGCYQYFDKAGKIIYVGKAANLKNRVLSYWQAGANHSPAKGAMMKEIARIEWIEVESEIEALLLESNLIKKHQPPFNVMLRDDKRFAYIKVSTEDEIPGIFMTRKIDKAGRYFGPFVSALAVRETLKAIRKIWPYCTERTLKPKPCFYHQIGRCVGVCGRVVSVKEYKNKVIKPIELFLEGKKKIVVKNLELRIKNLGKELKKKTISEERREGLERELNGSKYQLINFRSVLEHAHILGVTEKYAADVIELAKVLGLPRVPERIEGYDISNIFGQEATGSMVVFADGEADKNEYRKFKIKIGDGEANDVRMLSEIIERRFNNDWPHPDLIIIDGGKPQLNAAVRVLKRLKLDIPVIGISKGSGLRSSIAPDKLFFPGEKKPLELPLASPALHIIKRVRDEAHRFAIGYHRKLRGKRLFG